VTPGGQPGHQPVAGSRTQAGADVEAGGDAIRHDAAHQERDSPSERPGRRQHVEGHVDREPDHDDVADRADPGTLPQRDPQQQHQRADRDDDPAELDAGAPRDALVQHVPRVQAEAGPDHQRHADAEQDEAYVQVDQPANQRA